MPVPLLTRRALVRGTLVTVVGAVAGYLTARTTDAARGPRGTTAANAYGPSGDEAGDLLMSLDRLPTGGGVVLEDDRIVLTRSSAGEVHAFSAVCTHQGCTVTLAAGTIVCPCHGSRFDVDSGAVTRGPAARALPSLAVVVRNGEVYRS